MSVFRLATLNVHSFIDSQATSNIERLAQLLKPLALDVLAVQEACHTPDNRRNRAQTAFVETRYHSQVLSELLQLSYKVFGDNVRNFGNGILSRYPITNASNYQIEPQASEAVRGMLTVEVDNEFCKDNKATIHVTHFLDHISEHRRLSQLHLFDKHVLTTAQNSRHLQLLLGDFNSLTFEDYSQNYFDQKIRQVRDQNLWEPPYDLVIKKIKESGFQDCFKHMNKEMKNEQLATCAYSTRIDYIWMRGELKNGWQLQECKIFSTENATDHNGILLVDS